MSPTIQLQLLLATFAGWVCRQQNCVIDYLLEENRVLKEQIESSGRRMRVTDDQRRRLAAKGKPLGRRILQRIATIVSLDRMIFVGQQSLDRALKEYVEHYQDERSHQGIENRIVSGAAPQSEGSVQVTQRLGGMLSYYHRRVA